MFNEHQHNLVLCRQSNILLSLVAAEAVEVAAVVVVLAVSSLVPLS
jgi:hypothetical protein